MKHRATIAANPREGPSTLNGSRSSPAAVETEMGANRRD